MDVWVNFTHATKWQAERLFKLFFIPPRPSGPSSNESPPLGAPRENFTRAGRGASAHAVPVLEDEDIAQLAQRFANAIPEGEMSVWPSFFLIVTGFVLKAQELSRSRAYKGICSRIGGVPENASKRSQNGAPQSIVWLF